MGQANGPETGPQRAPDKEPQEMTPFLQCHVLTMESGAVYLARVMAGNRPEGLAMASELALNASALNESEKPAAVWDSAAFPCDDSQRAAGPGLELLRATSAQEAAALCDLTPETAEGLETPATAPQRAAKGPWRGSPGVESYTAPEAWASGLVNGDWSGTEPAEREAAEAWAATLGGPITSADSSGFAWRHDAFAFWPLGAVVARFSVLVQHKESQV